MAHISLSGNVSGKLKRIFILKAIDDDIKWWIWLFNLIRAFWGDKYNNKKVPSSLSFKTLKRCLKILINHVLKSGITKYLIVELGWRRAHHKSNVILLLKYEKTPALHWVVDMDGQVWIDAGIFNSINVKITIFGI